MVIPRRPDTSTFPECKKPHPHPQGLSGGDVPAYCVNNNIGDVLMTNTNFAVSCAKIVSSFALPNYGRVKTFGMRVETRGGKPVRGICIAYEYLLGSNVYFMLHYNFNLINPRGAEGGGGEKRPPENFRNISQTYCFSATKLSVPLEASIWHILTTEEISGQVRSRSYDVISEGAHDYFDLI